MRNSKCILAALILATLSACSKAELAAMPSAVVANAQNVVVPLTAVANANTQPVSKAGPATSRGEPQNVAPLGVEVGYANLEGVKAKFAPLTKLENSGINLYSGGPMLVSNGEGVGLDGLTELLFIFDKDDVLSAVMMTLPKNPTDVFGKLAGKYQVVENRIDKFMNYGTAKLAKGDTIVKIEAAHLSFEMSVTYMTKQFASEFARQSAEAKEQKRQEQTGKL